jgi:hypothetical protein
MAFFSLDDPNLWGRDTKGLEEVSAKGGMDGIALAKFILGKPENNATVATLLRMDPGYVLPNHGHNCYRLEVVLKGSITVGDQVFKPGTIMFSEPGALYGPHVAGPDGCITVEIFSDFKASHTTLMKGPQGLEECDLWTSEGAERMLQLVRSQQVER